MKTCIEPRRRHKQRICACCRRTFTVPRRDARYCSPACRQKAYRRRARPGASTEAYLTSTGYPVGRFPREKHADLDAVFAAAEPLPDEVEIPGEGKMSGADALVWALGELDTYRQLNFLEAEKLTPSKLRKRLHALVSAVGVVLQEFEIEGNISRFGWHEQLRNGLQAAARREAERIGGFPNYPPRTTPNPTGGKEITEY